MSCRTISDNTVGVKKAILTYKKQQVTKYINIDISFYSYVNI